jgi:hemolysin III
VHSEHTVIDCHGMEYRFLLEHQTLSSFIAIQLAQLAAFFVGWYLLFPEILKAQVSMGPLAILAAFLLTHLAWCFFEFFLHRYVLHLSVIPLFKIFEQKHNAHHELTYVRKVETGNGIMIENKFPILEDHQRKYSVFPWWVLIGFFCVITPLLAALQWLLPALPIFLGGYVAAFVTYVGYEIIHAYEHRSYELWWKPRMEHQRFGKYWTAFYSFHLNHHLSPRSNEAIGGFLGFPLADWMLGTWKRTSIPMVDGARPQKEDMVSPSGYWLIRTLDRLLGIKKKV